MKIADFRKIVSEVLSTMPQPHSEDIVDEVFFAIEQNDRLFRIYSECCTSLGRVKVNAAGESLIIKELARATLRVVPAKLSKLIDNYAVLNTKAIQVAKKATLTALKPKTTTAKKRLEMSARQALSDYYTANRASLPPHIALYREEILAFIRAGVPVADAFEKAVAQHAV